MRRILWFRRDLRTNDNPLLSLSGEVLPIFIFDPVLLSLSTAMTAGSPSFSTS